VITIQWPAAHHIWKVIGGKLRVFGGSSARECEQRDERKA
jgi:hypothetical protein